jgi:hypothetical protein
MQGNPEGLVTTGELKEILRVESFQTMHEG